MRQIASAVHQADGLQAIVLHTIKNEQIFERAFDGVGAKTLELWILELPVSPKIRMV